MNIPQIVAMGGGGFSMEMDNPVFERYIVAQSPAERPKVCFIGTASGDAEGYLVNFFMTFTALGCEPSVLPFFGRTPDMGETIMAQDIIYVGGGNSKSMLAVWREYGLPDILREAWQQGTILAGVSAGAICWYDVGLTDSSAAGIQPLAGLGFLPGSCTPHYDSEVERRPAFHRLLSEGAVPPGIALDDFAAAHYHGTDLHKVIASRPSAHGYRLEVGFAGPEQTTMPTEIIA